MESFRKVSEIGYRTIQVQWVGPGVSKEVVKEALDASELHCIGTQDYFEEVVSRLDEFIAMNQLWGGRSVCVSGIPPEYMSVDGCREFAAVLDGIAKKLAALGLVLELHPRSQEYALLEGRTAVERVLEQTQEPVGLGLDLYHVFRAGLDPVAWIGAWHERTEWVHFKDAVMDVDGAEQLVPVGQGVLPWPDIFAACLDKGIRYGFAEQERWVGDPFDRLQESFSYITSHGIGV